MQIKKCIVLFFGLALLFSEVSQSLAQTTSPVESPQSQNKLTQSEVLLAEKINLLLREKCEQDKFSGAILITKGDQLVTEGVCGQASKRYHAANNIETKFNIASIGKMFTAVAIAQLMEAGKLSYDDKLSRYVDASWYPKDILDKVTIRQLLSHRSGFGDMLSEHIVYAPYIKLIFLRELSDYKSLLQGDKLKFEPDSNFNYSNTGTFLLGLVIEKVSGENFFSYIREHIYKPLGMLNSDSYFRDEPVDNIATGYMSTPKAPDFSKENNFYIPLRGTPFGAGYSTVHDLWRFTSALLAGKLIKNDTLQLHWTDYSNGQNPGGRPYGLGFQVWSSALGKVVGHSGSLRGVAGNMAMYLDSAYTVIVLSNYDSSGYLPELVEDLISQANGK
ncbi:beta-lactamase family protein [Undibacterium sp. Jales W-56]|uniref:serine hydrolase domain-containing protein n=1 Tax=Undibacterium sp. Jales W-56 TaxID=2897325 RepID=UPI0021CE30C9|nr:serine hydrolase domain-containing protein [Undibacterium sp. Jales W-56]MCU6432494.1 beta-lactamase family protein [Undibacterium sp. Jales W-56]